MPSLDYTQKALRYARAVISGKKKAGKYEILACRRMIDDLENQGTRKLPFRYNKKRAHHVCQFGERLTHVKGPKAGELIHLEDWQCFILVNLFGWIDDVGNRRYIKAYIEVARGNGKSTLCSIIALYMLCADGEKGADVYSLATKKDQAKIVFGDALAMARGNRDLRDYYGLTCLTHSLVVVGTNSKFVPLSSDADTLDGLNTHLGIIDELHAHKTRLVYDVVNSSIGKRAQPMIISITTAGFLLTGICMDVRKMTAGILQSQIEDHRFFGIIYAPDRDDDWKSDDAILKANPNWKVSIKPETIYQARNEALVSTSAQKNYLTKYLNIWVNSDSQWLDMQRVRLCFDLKTRTPEEAGFSGKYTIYGIDLASKIDIAAIIKIFWRLNHDTGEVEYYVFYDFYLPEETILNGDNEKYEEWWRDGYLHGTPGAVTNITEIQDYVVHDAEKYQTLALGFDPMQATQMIQTLLSAGLPAVELFQSLKNLSEPMKQLQALIYSRRIHFSHNPVMEWMLGNVVCHQDAKENVYPRKEKSGDKIDGAVALIMALNQAIQFDIEHNYIENYDQEPLDWSGFKF